MNTEHPSVFPAIGNTFLPVMPTVLPQDIAAGHSPMPARLGEAASIVDSLGSTLLFLLVGASLIAVIGGAFASLG